ncbi:hypothetical protein AB4259_11130 [Vibrio amylolyticus]|uniref:hypothetical protein n=1 Tax=Vibrio amylolyticus TaxID=2847292 RepID=UPI003552B98A
MIESIGDTLSASISGAALENECYEKEILVRYTRSEKAIRAVIIKSEKVQTLF